MPTWVGKDMNRATRPNPSFVWELRIQQGSVPLPPLRAGWGPFPFAPMLQPLLDLRPTLQMDSGAAPRVSARVWVSPGQSIESLGNPSAVGYSWAPAICIEQLKVPVNTYYRKPFGCGVGLTSHNAEFLGVSGIRNRSGIVCSANARFEPHAFS